MKYMLFVFGLLLVFSSCQNSSKNYQKLETEIDSLQTQLNKSYKPGFGEFMSNIQMHHMKLWFAGKNENWPLAGFEINEIRENFEDITQYCKDRPETKLVGMIDQPLKNVNSAIRQKNLPQFKQNFKVLTNTCVSCHKATNHEFIHIQIPDENIFRNQLFKLNNENVTKNIQNQ